MSRMWIGLNTFFSFFVVSYFRVFVIGLDSGDCHVMLKHLLIHPQINAALGRAGHHARVLIADGNYPASTKKGPNAELVCLQLTPGVPTVAQVLTALLSALPIDQI